MNILLVGAVLLILVFLLRRDYVARFRSEHLVQGDLEAEPTPLIPKRWIDLAMATIVVLFLLAIYILLLVLGRDSVRYGTPTVCTSAVCQSSPTAVGGGQ